MKKKKKLPIGTIISLTLFVIAVVVIVIIVRGPSDKTKYIADTATIHVDAISEGLKEGYEIRTAYSQQFRGAHYFAVAAHVMGPQVDVIEVWGVLAFENGIQEIHSVTLGAEEYSEFPYNELFVSVDVIENITKYTKKKLGK